MQHASMHVGQSEIAALVPIRQLLVIDAQEVQHRRVQIEHFHRIVRDVVGEVVGRAVDSACA